MQWITPTIGKIFSGNKEAYAYLNKSVIAFPEGNAFLAIFEKVGFTFEIDSHNPGSSDGVFVQKVEDKFQLRIFSHGKKIFEGILSESELLYKISEHYNELMRDLRSFEVNNQITKFEWKAVNVVRKIKKLRYGRTIRLKKKN